ARLRPAIEAVVDRRIRTVTLRQVAPRRAGPQHEEDAVQHLTVVRPRPPVLLARRTRQQRPAARPFLAPQIDACHPGLLLEALNHLPLFAARGFGYRT